MSSKLSIRHAKKVRLLRHIDQQRATLAMLEQEWLATMHSVDGIWQRCYHYRKAIALSLSSLLLVSLRKPKRIVKVSKGVVKLWGTSKIVRRALLALRGNR